MPGRRDPTAWTFYTSHLPDPVGARPHPLTTKVYGRMARFCSAGGRPLGPVFPAKRGLWCAIPTLRPAEDGLGGALRTGFKSVGEAVDFLAQVAAAKSSRPLGEKC